MSKEKKKYILVSGDAFSWENPIKERVNDYLSKEFPDHVGIIFPENGRHYSQFEEEIRRIINYCREYKWPGIIVITQSYEMIQVVHSFFDLELREEFFEYRRYESKDISKPKIYTWEDLKVAFEAALEVR